MPLPPASAVAEVRVGRPKLWGEHHEALSMDLFTQLTHAHRQIEELGGTVNEHGAWLEGYAREKLAADRYLMY